MRTQGLGHLDQTFKFCSIRTNERQDTFLTRFALVFTDDDVVKYQKLIKAACIANAGDMGLEIINPPLADMDSYCDTYARQDKKSHVCELILYQSLRHDRIESGDGTPATAHYKTFAEKDAAGHDADGLQNGYTAVETDHPLYQAPDGLMNAVPKCALRVEPSAHTDPGR